jgi:hypothetical protein
MDYKKLSKYDKLSVIQKYNFAKCERHSVAIYLKALWLNDVKTINEYERFGKKPYQFFMNKRTYESQLLFGYTGMDLDQYGWLEAPELNNYEELVFSTKKENNGLNRVSIGQGLNGKWSFSVSYSTGAAGGGSKCGI